MTIRELSDKTGLTIQAIYKQIKNQTGYGRFFKRNLAGKWEFPAKLFKEGRNHA